MNKPKKNFKIKKLNLGSGWNYRSGYLNLDNNKEYKPDVLWDMQKFPYPFKDNTFDEINMEHILEHFCYPLPILEECYRIAKPNAKVVITVPHWSHYSSWADLTHQRCFSITSFNSFSDPVYYSKKANFSVFKRRYIITRNTQQFYKNIFNILLGPVINALPKHLVELLVCKIIPISEMNFVLNVEKNNSALKTLES